MGFFFIFVLSHISLDVGFRVSPQSTLKARSNLTSTVSMTPSDRQKDADDRENGTVTPSNCMFPAVLAGRFLDDEWVGGGANGCVFVARARNSRRNVAVKTSRRPGERAQFHSECDKLQQLHQAARKRGPTYLKMVWQYIPSCLEAGGTEEEPYIVKHATTGNTPFEQWRELGLSKEDKIGIFAQLVAAIWTLHGIGFAHNDLWEANMMLDSDSKALALIDFDTVSMKEDAFLAGNDAWRRDANVIWRYLGQLAECPGEFYKSKFAKASNSKRAAVIQCLTDTWRPDVGFLHALHVMMDREIKGTMEQGIGWLFGTVFVQANLPPLRAYYHNAQALTNSVESPAYELKTCMKAPRFRRDCGDVGADKCQEIGCCWLPQAPHGTPWCYKAENPPLPTGVTKWEPQHATCEVPGQFRKHCGPSDVTPTTCTQAGCCWREHKVSGVPWCFQKAIPA